MNSERLQNWVDGIRTASTQRWVLCIITLVMPAVAYGAAAAASQQFSPSRLVLIVALAAIAASRPDSHLGLVVIGVDIWFWLAVVHHPTTAWSIVAAAALFAFHATTALMSTTPHNASADDTTMRRWLIRCSAIVLVTIAAWLLVAGLDRLHPAGNIVAAAAALSAVAATTLLLRTRSLGRR